MDQENTPQQQPPQPPPPPKKRRGCKIALIVVGVIVVILVVGGYFACPRLAKVAIDKSLSALEAKVVEELPPGYSEAEVHTIFDKVRTAFKEGKIKGDKAGVQIQNASQVIQAALQDGKLTPEETDKILETMKDLLRATDDNK